MVRNQSIALLVLVDERAEQGVFGVRRYFVAAGKLTP
jgi:hypothetical protein